MYGTLHVLATQHRVLRRMALTGLVIWGVVHTTAVVGSLAFGVTGLTAGTRGLTVGLTTLLLWIDLRASRDFLFHANLGVPGRVLVLAGVLPGMVAEILLHARQATGAACCPVEAGCVRTWERQPPSGWMAHAGARRQWISWD